MIPDAMDNFFIASTGASAALVGLIFVAISLWPRDKMRAAPPTWRAVAGGSFFCPVQCFFHLSECSQYRVESRMDRTGDVPAWDCQ
jgi:hypothetical protein